MKNSAIEKLSNNNQYKSTTKNEFKQLYYQNDIQRHLLMLLYIHLRLLNVPIRISSLLLLSITLNILLHFILTLVILFSLVVVCQLVLKS